MSPSYFTVSLMIVLWGFKERKETKEVREEAAFFSEKVRIILVHRKASSQELNNNPLVIQGRRGLRGTTLFVLPDMQEKPLNSR